MELLPWAEKAFNYGVPTGLLIVVAFGVWRGVGWAGRELFIPIRNRVTLFMDGMLSAQVMNAESRQAQTRIMASQEEKIGVLSHAMQAIEHGMQTLARKQDEHLEICKGDAHGKPPRQRHQ